MFREQGPRIQPVIKRLVTQDDRWKRWGMIALALAVVAGIMLRFVNLDGKVVWIDEVHSLMRVAGYGKEKVVEHLEATLAATETRPAQLVNLSDLLQFQRPPESQGLFAGLAATVQALATDNPQHPPVYYLAARLMVALFGPAITTVRGTAALFGVALIPAMGWLAWVLWRSPLIAMTTMAIAAVSPFQIAYAQEAREYSALALMMVLTTGLLLRAMDGVRRGWWWYGGAIAVGLYTHLLMGYGIVAHGVMVLGLVGWRSPVTRKFALAIIGAVVTFIPWIVTYLTYFKGIAWIGRDLGFLGLLRRWAVGWTLPMFDLQSLYHGVEYSRLFDVSAVEDFTNLGWGWGLIVLCGGLWGWSFWQLWRGPRRATWVVATLGLVPFLMLAIPDLLDGGQRSTVGRFLMPVVLALQLALAHGLAVNLRSRPNLRSKKFLVSYIGLVLVVMMGLSSSWLQLQSSTGWNKYSSYYDPAIAQILMESDNPLLITGAEKSGRLMSIAHYVNGVNQDRETPFDPQVLLVNKPAVPGLFADPRYLVQTLYLYRPYGEMVDGLQANNWTLETVHGPGQLIRLIPPKHQFPEYGT